MMGKGLRSSMPVPNLILLWSGVAVSGIALIILFCRAAVADSKPDVLGWLPFPVADILIVLKILLYKRNWHAFRWELLFLIVGLGMLATGLFVGGGAE
jgi:hypothetical protein